MGWFILLIKTFSLANANASDDTSIVPIKTFSCDLAKQIDIHPVPVPISRTDILSFFQEADWIVVSTNISVSGLGINALGSHLNVFP